MLIEKEFLNSLLDFVHKEVLNGGAGSGDFDHAGRPGLVGGSEPAGTGRNGKYADGKKQWIGKKIKKDLEKDGYTLKKVDDKPVVEIKEINKKENEITILKETQKAFLLKKDDTQFWVQKRWYKDGNLTPAGNKSFEEAKEKKDLKTKKVKFTPSWENEKAYGVDIAFDMYDLEETAKVRIFIPKSMVENNTIPYWLFDKKMKEANQKMTDKYGSRLGGWFPKTDFEFSNSKKNVIYAIIDGELYLLEK